MGWKEGSHTYMYKSFRHASIYFMISSVIQRFVNTLTYTKGQLFIAYIHTICNLKNVETHEITVHISHYCTSSFLTRTFIKFTKGSGIFCICLCIRTDFEKRVSLILEALNFWKRGVRDRLFHHQA